MSAALTQTSPSSNFNHGLYRPFPNIVPNAVIKISPIGYYFEPDLRAFMNLIL